MIGIRGGLSTILAAALCAAGLAGTEGPARAIAADRLVGERASRADHALAALEEALAPAVEAARRGAGRIVSGDEPPGESFDAAAKAVTAAAPRAREAAEAVDALDAARRARRPGTPAIGPVISVGSLSSIAGQLEATGAAGDGFAATRRAADGVVPALERALGALAAGDLDAAESATRLARSAHDEVAGWDEPPESLPVWLETTDAMIDAMDGIVKATRAGDGDAAQKAADTIRGLADDAAAADRGLRIAVSEGGGALASTALGRLAAELDALASARIRVSAVLAERRP